jgi:hypothetical protein
MRSSNTFFGGSKFAALPGGVKLSILRSQGLPVGAHSGITVNSHVPFSIFEHNI